jgi:hypothetical protein
MKRHSQTPSASAAPTGFLGAWQRLLGAAPVPTLAARRGRKPRVPVTDVLSALTFHMMNGPGTLGEHFVELFDEPLADSSVAGRRARVPWDVFAELMRRVSRPRATRTRDPEAFWRGWRLVAIDGTQWDLTNTPQIGAEVRKPGTRRSQS